MNKVDLRKILHGDIALIDQVNCNDAAAYNDEVPVHPEDLRKMLERYLSNAITANELNTWAKFICLRAEYCSLEYLDDQKALYYEDMWYVIQKISTPEIDGDISSERIKQYLSELDKYML